MAQTTDQYTIQDVANYAYRAGFRGTDLSIATAIGWAESRGKSDAVSSDGYNSHGFWQFIPSTWASITHGSAFTNADNPQANANAAYALQKQSGWSQWSTYNNKAYLAFLPQASAAATKASATGGQGTKATDASFTANPTSLWDWINPFTSPISPLAPITGGAGGAVGSVVSSIFKPLVDYMVDAGLVVGGIILILFGILELSHEVRK